MNQDPATLDQIAAIDDPEARAAAAADLINAPDARLLQIRDQAIAEAVTAGTNVTHLAAACGLSRQSIYNIAGQPIPRRQCGGTTAQGLPCHAYTTNENGWCGRCAHPPAGVDPLGAGQ